MSWGCTYEDRCQNGPHGSEQCYRCSDHHLLSLPEDTSRRRAIRKSKTLSSSSESWRSLEEETAKRLNASPYRTLEEAHRQLRSGGIWFMPGDVADPIMLYECKERGQETSRGEKNFTIKKDWLEKIMEEGKQVGRFPGLVFRFKEDDRLYVIKDFSTEEEMVWYIRSLQEELARKDELIRLLRRRQEEI